MIRWLFVVCDFTSAWARSRWRTFVGSVLFGLALTGCNALRAALPGLFTAGATVATDLSAAERAKAEATRCEAGRKATAKRLDAIAAELHEVRGYVAADAAQERDAGVVHRDTKPENMPDAGAEGGP